MSLIRKKTPEVICPGWYKDQFMQFNLQKYRGQYVLLFFYPNDFSFVCPTQIISFSNLSAEFREVGCQIFAISTNSVFNHMEYTKKSRSQGGLGSIDIPLLSDITQNISKNYGCLCESEGVAFRGTYIIDKNGIVRHESIMDRQVGRNPEEYLRLVKAFIFSDQSGQVCPAKWEPGQKSMIPNTNNNQYKEVISSMQIQHQ